MGGRADEFRGASGGRPLRIDVVLFRQTPVEAPAAKASFRFGITNTIQGPTMAAGAALHRQP
jgi:hypothetical protein